MRLLYFSFIAVLLSCNHERDEEVINSFPEPELENDDTDYGLHVAFLIMDGTYNTELTAPMDIFHHTKFRDGIKPMKVFTIAKSLMK